MASGWGRKKTLFFAGCMFFISALGSMEPEFLLFNRGEASFNLMLMFNFYRIVGGIGVGLASAVCPMYIGEVSPSNIRGMLVSWNQFAIIFGQLVVYFVNFIILGDHIAPAIQKVAEGINQVMNPGEAQWMIETGWRYMFVSEAVPAGLFTLLLFLVPETPRYLAMTGNDAQALTILTKINGKSKAQEILAEIKATVSEKTEKLFTYGWLVIFVGIMLSVFQQAVGINAVLYFAPRIFESLGMGNPMMQTVLMGVVNITFTLVAIFTVEKWGRKPLLIWGSLGMALGAAGVAVTSVSAALPPIVAVISIMVYSASFMFSWGPICWVLISEIFPNTIRGAAVAIAVAFQWIFNFIVSSTFLPMYNMSLGSMGENFGHAFTYGLYGVICIIAAIFVWKLVPETKGKTLEDMSKLWKK
jgi:SP family xylose:H+ symportor-like MFS transporter